MPACPSTPAPPGSPLIPASASTPSTRTPDTPFTRRIETASTGQPSQHAARAFDAMIPLGLHAAPEEIARPVLHLAGDDASSTTGATVAVDGGLSVREASPS
ncbi:SDR family oxidoreductase [Actinacidiphila glaucinigra]|uniref:SDR family oxidoreductase n=1 Tax=Actinacidiphila glaucinigra TaxID=235986 RepID=UPI003F55AA11